MSDTDEAYAAAIEEIARMRFAGETRLMFSEERFRALDRIPPEVRGIEELVSLDLSETNVGDLAPLSGLTSLKALFLHETPVQDLSPLRAMPNLYSLFLGGSQVADLRPILGLPALGTTADLGLYFRDTPAARATEELARLAAIRSFDDCARETKAYLATLPPWPAPLPWEGTDTAATAPDPLLPGSTPAPLQVAEVDGMLQPAYPGNGLADRDQTLARQGWAALRDYLEDLDDQKPRIGNTMPRLVAAVNRLEAALGEDYAEINPIAVGTQGNRVIRLSAGAADALMEEDAADIAAFAAALALFLERFDEWRDYKDVALRAPPAPETIAEVAPKVAELAADLSKHAEIAECIPKSLAAQAHDAADEPEDALVATGLVGSLGNVLSALATKAMPVLSVMKREAGDIASKTWEGTKKAVAGALVAGGTGLAGAAADIFTTKGATLRWLAEQFPEKLGWLARFLNALGLG